MPYDFNLGFYGVGSVTGANFMLDTGKVALLVDCGLVQGDQFAQEVNAAPFVYDPAHVDILLVTHAHADHIGRIPKLVKDGFTGDIYSTPPTRDLANVMLRDAVKVMRYEEERYENHLYDKRRRRPGAGKHTTMTRRFLPRRHLGALF